jgi:hypothetical protein
MIVLYYYQANNFGDQLSPKILKWLTKNLVISASVSEWNSPFYFLMRSRDFRSLIKILLIIIYKYLLSRPIYMFIGSILSTKLEGKVLVLGSGFISEDSKILNKTDFKFYLVRGPLTWANLPNFFQRKWNGKTAFGDPGILLSEYFDSLNNSQLFLSESFKKGLVISHVNTVDVLKNKLSKRNINDFDFISMSDSMAEIMMKINSCDLIVTNTLHGLIAAHSFGRKVILLDSFENIKGGKFKFEDYLGSLREYGFTGTFQYLALDDLAQVNLYDILSRKIILESSLINAVSLMKLSIYKSLKAI